jgi:FKBP-type peptidyl-prolyl cis-trans isomerase 2
MTDHVQKGDFIEIEFTGRLKEDGHVFDTTSKEVAEKEGLRSHRPYGPFTVCIGERHILPGLDEKLTGASLGKHTFEIPPEQGFGKKSAKLIQLIPRKVFKEQDIQPFPGLEINVDNQTGIVRTVGGGRIIVDFNHPLASKDLLYEVEVLRKVTDKAAQVKAVLDAMMLHHHGVTVKEDGSAEVEGVSALPPQLLEIFTKDIVRLTGVKDVLFKPHEAHHHAHDDAKKDVKKLDDSVQDGAEESEKQ